MVAGRPLPFKTANIDQNTNNFVPRKRSPPHPHFRISGSSRSSVSDGSIPSSRRSASVGSRPISLLWSATASSRFASAVAREAPCVVTPVSTSVAIHQSSSRQRRISASWLVQSRLELAILSQISSTSRINIRPPNHTDDCDNLYLIIDSCRSCSISVATAVATDSPNARSRYHSARSIPEVTPPAVRVSPSSTTRASVTSA